MTAESTPVEVIDAHQHIWTLARADYPWMDPGDAVLHRDFLIDEAVSQLDAAGVSGTVLVQSADNAEDSEVMFDAARANARVRGVVAWVPLDDAVEAGRMLDRWSAEPAFCGIRTLIHTRDDATWLASAAVDPALRLLVERGIPLDVIAVNADHLRSAIAIGERHPGLRMVIDHLGHPPIGAADDGRWSALMAEAAANPATCAKISGLYMTAGPMDAWTTGDLTPYIDRAVELFGADRLMYGGDWPISELAGGYDRVWRRLSGLIAAYGTDRAARILSGTAADFYRLGGAAAHAMTPTGVPAEGDTP